jgi:bacteriocin-like protein
MFTFGKKNAEVTEQVMEEVTDEQLSQVSGGSLLNVVSLENTLGIVGNVTGLATETVGSVSVSGVQAQAAGFSVSTPTIVPGTLLP